MIEALLDSKGRKGLRVLALGAHCDDIEIGCGGTLLKWLAAGRIEQLHWVVFTSNEVRKDEAINCARAFTQGLAKVQIEVLSYRDAFLNFSGLEVKEQFEQIKQSIDPDVVFTHYRQDRHQDHRLLSDLAWNTFRNHLILEYEIPKYDGDLGIPNCFVHLDDETAQRKTNLLTTHYKSQHNKHWFEAETFLSLMRLRGLESAQPQKYAEAFHLRKLLFQ